MTTTQQLLFWGILFVVFLVIREFWTWYFKLNRVVELLESIDRSLKSRGTSP